MKIIMVVFLILQSGLAMSQTLTGEVLLKRIDKNMSSENSVLTSKMIIHGTRGSRTIASKTWTQGTEKSFTEYLSPAREKGTKMLMLEDNLWMYSPSTDRIIQISGHLLKQSVMGSDLSYEDMMEDPQLSEQYDAVITGEDVVDDRLCWIVELTAKVKDVAYHFQKLWVDKEREVPLKEELYAKGGKLLKKLELKDVTRIENRWYPKRLIFKDMLKTGEGTKFIIETIQFDIEIPPRILTKASLRK